MKKGLNELETNISTKTSGHMYLMRNTRGRWERKRLAAPLAQLLRSWVHFRQRDRQHCLLTNHGKYFRLKQTFAAC